jgi:flagellar biosynthesis protein FliQ
MDWQQGVHLVQSAVATALWVALPLIAAVLGAGLLAGHLQAAIGQSDPVALLPPRLLGAALGLLLLGSWMLACIAQYWTALWRQAALLVAAGR